VSSAVLRTPSAPAPARPSLLRARSDEALVALVRQGRDDAFEAIVARYRDRLLAYARHTLRGADEAEDVVQDVFIRAHRALRRDDRPMVLKPWLYKIAHNRCMDVLRRPVPLPTELAEDGPDPAAGTADVAERRDDLRALVGDIAGLPDQQRSALIIRELEGLSYEDLAATLETTVPAVKSLLVRARIGLAEAAEARALPCAQARAELERGARLSARVRRHVRGCHDCTGAKAALGPRRTRAAVLTPVLLAPLTRLLGLLPGGGAGADLAGAAGPGRAVAAVASMAVIGGAVAAPVAHHQPAPKVAAASAAVPSRLAAPRVVASRPQPVTAAPTPVEWTVDRAIRGEVSTRREGAPVAAPTPAPAPAVAPPVDPAAAPAAVAPAAAVAPPVDPAVAPAATAAAATVVDAALTGGVQAPPEPAPAP
jgi:RNA polymerase sigma factor (sigma-70 family)